MTFMTMSELRGKKEERRRGQKISNREERNRCGREEREERGSERQLQMWGTENSLTRAEKKVQIIKETQGKVLKN